MDEKSWGIRAGVGKRNRDLRDGRTVKFKKKGQGAVLQVEKDGRNTGWKIGELGILCQEEEQGVDSKEMWKSYDHKSERLPFWGARRAGIGDLRTLLW